MTFLSANLSLTSVIAVAVIAFGLGLLTKSATYFKQRKRILNLEDEMLSNHSKILSLEKKLMETRQGISGMQDFDYKSNRETKAS